MKLTDGDRPWLRRKLAKRLEASWRLTTRERQLLSQIDPDRQERLGQAQMRALIG